MPKVLMVFGLVLALGAAMSPPADFLGDRARFDEHAWEQPACTTAYINTTYWDATGRWHSDNTETGKFGEGRVGPAYGVLVHVRSYNGDDPTACTWPLTSRMGELPPSEPWIALIKRGHCDFAVKVLHAIKANASAVLIYNDRKSESLDKMSIPPDRRNISAVFTFKDRGETLARLVDNGTRVMVFLNVGTQCAKPTNINRPGPFAVSFTTWPTPAGRARHDYTDTNRTSVLFVSISFIVLMIISLAWLVFYYVQRFRYIHAKDRLSRQLCSAAKKALSKIPTKNIKCEDREMQGDGECCAVCIEPYKVSDVLRILPCRHEFHKFCIDPWLLEHRTCPMCKMDILKHYGFVAPLLSRTRLGAAGIRTFTGSQESILHLEIEEVAGLDSGGNDDSEEMQNGAISSSTQLRSPEHQISGSVSPEVQSQSSRASSPDEFTPTLYSGQCYMGSTSRPGCESPSLMETSTQYSTATADAHQKSEKCSNCMMKTSMVSENPTSANNNCDTVCNCNCQMRQTPSCDIEDCELESCDSLSASLNASPIHESSPRQEHPPEQ